MAAEQGLWAQKDLCKNLDSRNEIFTSCDGFHQNWYIRDGRYKNKAGYFPRKEKKWNAEKMEETFKNE